MVYFFDERERDKFYFENIIDIKFKVRGIIVLTIIKNLPNKILL